MMILVSYTSFSAQEPDTLILKNADYNENTFVGNKLVSVLRGNVEFHYGEMKIFSQDARWWRDEGKIALNRDVRVEKEGQELTCDRMNYYKDTDLLVAAGHFDYRSRKDNLRLIGRNGQYDLKQDFLTLTGDPQFFRYDTAAAETLTISGKVMTYSDSLKVATSKDSVVITKGKLASRCRQARYLTDELRAELRGDPRIFYEIHLLTGDSVNLFFDGDTLEGISVSGNSHGLYREAETADTSVTNIWSDSLYMALTAGGELDSVWAIGDVLSTYYLSTEPDTANEVSGKQMVLAFDDEGQLGDATVWGSARSIYHVREQEGRGGRNEASGDSIVVFFREGKASHLTLKGDVRGVYFPRTD